MKNLHHILFFLILALTSIAFFFSPELRDIVVSNTQIDTIGHAIGFFVLTWLTSSLFKLPAWPLTIALIGYAALSEVAQYSLGFRNGEFKDFVGDTIGILLFMLLKWLWLVYGPANTASVETQSKSQMKV
ncbi:VanZ family protein [Thalassotalea euphylliae]|uniref:VanZ family protein n=1 Tax=Thalassotalea euphylliae TaxID=1655234 RepID=UPI0011C0687F|nr:VanZ family protein [Thalassotalea euphylliae]